jgi:hypothetical protein
MLEQLDLSQRSLRKNLLAKHICHLLDSNTRIRLLVGSGAKKRSASIATVDLGSALPDDSIRSLSEFLCHIILLIDHKLLIENLEDLAALEIGCSHGGGGGVEGQDGEDGLYSQKYCERRGKAGGRKRQKCLEVDIEMNVNEYK